MSQQNYQLIDFGDSRKLERFGDLILDRPSPPAENSSKANPETWNDANGVYIRKGESKGKWHFDQPQVPKNWTIDFDFGRFELRPTPFGHVGIFAEQIANWKWIQDSVKRIAKADNSQQPRILNLFAYTGGSTIAAAQAGAKVTHIDSAKNVVQWARRNAELSELRNDAVRWIAEDAKLFVQREVKRGNQYDGIILDPPTYGHGPKGEVWQIQRDLMPLLRNCKKLMAGNPKLILLSCHSAGFGPAELQAFLADSIFGTCSAGAMGGQMTLKSEFGKTMNCGSYARWAIT